MQHAPAHSPMHSHSQSQAHSQLPQSPQSPRSPRLEGKGFDLPCNTGGVKALRTNGEPCAHSVDCSQKRYEAGLVHGHGTRGWVSSPGCRGDERMSQPSSPVVAMALSSPVKHFPPKEPAAALPTRTLRHGTDKQSVYMVVEKHKKGVVAKGWAYVDSKAL